MPAPKGHKQYGGRQKGTPNKDKATVLERLRALKCDPIEVLAMFAKGDWKGLGYQDEKVVTGSNDFGTFYKYTVDPAVRARCAQDLMKYAYPQKKAVEVTGKDGGPIETNESEVSARIKQELREVWLEQLAERRKKTSA